MIEKTEFLDEETYASELRNNYYFEVNDTIVEDMFTKLNEKYMRKEKKDILNIVYTIAVENEILHLTKQIDIMYVLFSKSHNIYGATPNYESCIETFSLIFYMMVNYSNEILSMCSNDCLDECKNIYDTDFQSDLVVSMYMENCAFYLNTKLVKLTVDQHLSYSRMYTFDIANLMKQADPSVYQDIKYRYISYLMNRQK
jgi:hypothetical protein